MWSVNYHAVVCAVALSPIREHLVMSGNVGCHKWGRGVTGIECACNAEDPGLIRGLGRSPGEGNGGPFQYSCLENSVDRGAWPATVHAVTKSWTWLRTEHANQNYNEVIMPHQSEWPSSKNLQTINAGEDIEKRESSCTLGNVNWYSHYGEQYGDSLKN